MQHMTVDAMHRPIRNVLIVDDHPLYSDALASALEHIFPQSIFEKAGSLRAALEKLDRNFEPDLVLFDLKLPDVAGLSGFTNLKARLGEIPILVISSLASPDLIATLMAEGAAGFMPKDSPVQELRVVLEEIASGRTYVPKDFCPGPVLAHRGPAPNTTAHPDLATLTPQQQRVMKLICAGKPNKQIAYELDLAEATVKAHITALLRRLGVHNRTQAAVLFESAQLDIGDGAPESEVRSFLSH